MTTAPFSNSFNYVVTTTVAEAPRLDQCPIRNQRSRLPEGDPGRRLLLHLRGKLVLAETDTADFTPRQIRGIRDDTGQIYLDVGRTPLPDDFGRDLLPLRRATECSGCDARPLCPGAWRAIRIKYDIAHSEAFVQHLVGAFRGRVLDVGVGHPHTLAPMLTEAGPGDDDGLPFDYTGIEPDPDRVREVRRFFPALTVVEAAAEDSSLGATLGPPPFDHAMLLRSYNHLRDPSLALVNVLSLLRPGGTLLVADNVPFALVRSRRRMRELGLIERVGAAPFEHYRNHTSHEALREHLGDLEVLDHQPVDPHTANQWVLHLRKPERDLAPMSARG